MKQFFFLLTMLASVIANAQVTHVDPIGANYTNQTVSFRVRWNAGTRDATHLSKVWVWVDYIIVNSNNTTSGNTWTRATVSSASPTASVSYDGSNRKGFWLQGNSGSYSATVTVQLNITASKFNWCAYASDYPPNVTLNKGTYTFKGTTNFLVNSHVQPLTSKTITKVNLTVDLSSTFTDATGCPGIGSLYCPYTGSDLYMDATHLCRQRSSGAQNWEAYIQDARDNKIYRITQYSDDSWWMADALSISDKRVGICNGFSFYDGRNKPDCPIGWILPTLAQVSARNLGYDEPYGASYVHSGWWNRLSGGCTVSPYVHAVILVNGCTNGLLIADSGAMEWHDNPTGCNGTLQPHGRIRCFRQL
jgi:hypothetical protein